MKLYNNPKYAILGSLTTVAGTVVYTDYITVPSNTIWIITHISVSYTYSGTSYHFYDISKDNQVVHGIPLAGNGSTKMSTALYPGEVLRLKGGEQIRGAQWDAGTGATATFTMKYYEVIL